MRTSINKACIWAVWLGTWASITIVPKMFALTVTIGESASALIKPQAEHYSSNYNGGTRTTLNTANPNGYCVAGIIMWYFNLGPYAGWTTTNEAEVTVGQNWGEASPRIFRIYAIQSNWHESTVTWENWLGPGTTNSGNRAFTNWLGPELGATNVVFVDQDTLTRWRISAEAVRSWLDGSAPYYGLAIVPDLWGNNMFYTRSATWKPNQIPKLTMEVYPAPQQEVATNRFRVRNEVRMANVPRVGLNIAGYARYHSLTMRELLPLGNFEPLLHGSLHFASGTQSTASKWVTGSGPSLGGMDVRGFRLEVLTGSAAGKWAVITNAVGGQYYLDRSLGQPAENDAFAIRGVVSNFYRDYYVITNVFASHNVRPGAVGVMCARFGPNSELTYLMDHHTTPSYIVFTGTYSMSFWARAEQAGQALQIVAARWNWGSQYLFNQWVPLQTNWTWYAFTNTVVNDPNGTNFRVTLRRSGGSGSVYIDDWSLQKVLPVSHSVYTREGEDAITNVLTWCGRHWMGQLGDTLDNFLAPRAAQMPTEDKVWGSGYYPTLPEFLHMCQQLRLGSAWICLPPIFSTNEGLGLIEYLAGPTHTAYGQVRAQRGRVAPWTEDLELFLELGNEVWHYQNGPPYARMITQLYGAMKQSPWFDYDRIHLVMGGQAGNNWRAQNTIPVAKYYDCYDNAGYTMGSYSDTNTADTFGALMAYHDFQYNGDFGYQRDLLRNDGRGKCFTIYEMNMHTTEGTAPEGVRNEMVTSVGAAVAGFDALLTHYYQSQVPSINVFAMMGNGYNYGGGVVKLWGIYSSLEMGQLKRPYYHSMLGANRAIGEGAHLLVSEPVGTLARWTQPLRNGVSGTFPFMKCYAFMASNVYRVVLVNRDWVSNRTAVVELPFTYNGIVSYLLFRPDNGSPWSTVESHSFTGWVAQSTTMSGSNLVMTLPASSFAIASITNMHQPIYELRATRVGPGRFDRNPSGRYVHGTVVTASAFPDDGQSFYGWTGAVVANTQTVALVVTNTLEVVAWFQPIPECAWGLGGMVLILDWVRRMRGKRI
ncbi:MAG: hypothetical protein N2595_02635 [bacterium]|nr:hypothetical protein [bacterium]